MTNESNDLQEPSEERLVALLRSVEVGAPPLDETILESLRIRTATVFDRTNVAIRSANEAGAADSVVLPGGISNEDLENTEKTLRRQPMIMVIASRGIAGLLAVASAIVLWLGLMPTSTALSTTPFSAVLKELRSAISLQLKIRNDGKSVDVWVRAPELIRREESPQRYEIASGSRLWRIDETENTATESDSPWFVGPQEPIDLLGLMDLGFSDTSALLESRPVERTTRSGRECVLYRATLPTLQGLLEIEATADAKSLQLLEIQAWKPGKKDQGRPAAEMRLIAMNPQVADEKFIVSKSLTDDGRIGKISEAQGIVGLRPMLAKRWTPICRETLLRPGDWLRTELRGANAVKATLSSDVVLTLGPGTLLECISANEARLHSGMVQIVSPKEVAGDTKKSFTLLGPRDGKRNVLPGEKRIVRVDRDESLADIPQTPAWLAGFEGTSNQESLGSLIVNLPDGRNEPLSVGYHKVSVEIRDQIARTTIEESFVNHTANRLEGVFHFPLPQDASISGFGMWIGNDLVEADVVEKQRAREIYETILREKRDPGLLEWTGGNIFKARVFPIEARSEKRVKIVYTQVLPLRANRYRYSYGLRSELLRTTPLRELSLSVTVNSAMGLKSVHCPTHTTRIQQTEHSAQVEFSAQEYSPTRDFEVVCEVDSRQSDVVVVPHRRGDDGYFLIQLTPPGAEGNWQRELLPDGEPQNVVLLCDTSASMVSEKRKQQSDFVTAVLASLGSDDRFQLAGLDVETAWASEEPMVVNAENIAKATQFLADRNSLGWTNLDRAFEDAINKSPTNAQVIYIGDGIVSAGDTDPAAFVKRLGVLVGKPTSSGPHRTFHAVTVGNSNESVVLKGIASVGGGSVRAISGEQTAQTIALELLNEIAQPGLRDLNVEFRGLKVAAVYPERLPNVAAGTQQILVGRYLPEENDQQGEIVVTGKRGSEIVRYAAKLNLKDAEEGNSFIPRLWARSHLDLLLSQGNNQSIQDEIIQLSEEFHIITPYTSLLVLETDADRERFGVQRRYEMRDGERFFADGRDNANFELLHQQMKRAGDWRVGMRRQILGELARLGRNTETFQNEVRGIGRQTARRSGMNDFGKLGIPTSGSFSTSTLTISGTNTYTGSTFVNGGTLTLGGIGGFAGNGRLSNDLGFNEAYEGADKWESDITKWGESRDRKDLNSIDLDIDIGNSGFSGHLDFVSGVHAESLSKQMLMTDALGKRRENWFGFGFDSMDESSFAAGQKGQYGITKNGAGTLTLSRSKSFSDRRGYYDDYKNNQPDYLSWMKTLFPELAPKPEANARTSKKETESWTPDAITLANSLLRIDSLTAVDGGIELRRHIEYFDPRWNRSVRRNVDLAMYSPSAWLTRGMNWDDHTLINYCDLKERCCYSLAFGLGQSRASVASELHPSVIGLTDFSLSSIRETYSNWLAIVETAGENQQILVLKTKDTANVVQFTIDSARHVLLKQEVFNDGKLNSVLQYEDFTELAGKWWAKRVVQFDEQEKVTTETLLDIRVLTKDEFAQRLIEQTATKASVQFVQNPLGSMKVARQRIADGSASFDDRMLMILHNAQLQQWDEMWKHVEAIEKMAVDKPGVRWIRTVLLATIRRNEEARQRLIQEAQKLAPKAQQDEVFLAEFILGHSNNTTEAAEFRAILQLLKPIYERSVEARIPAVPARRANDDRNEQKMLKSFSSRIEEIWIERNAASLERLGMHEEQLSARRKIAESAPWNAYAQQLYAQRLSHAGLFSEGYAWLQKELARPERTPIEDDMLRNAGAELLRQQGSWDELLKWTTDWIAKNPVSDSYYTAYANHLAAMIFNDQLDEAYALVDKWMKDARVDGKMTNIQRKRFDAALHFANGQLPGISYQRMNERWFESLSETAKFFTGHPNHADIVSQCISNHYFNRSDVADRLRGHWLTILRKQADSLSPSTISSLIGWTMSGRIELAEPLDGKKQLDASEVPMRVWDEIAKSLKSRWTLEEDRIPKGILSDSLINIYTNRFRDSLLLPFHRERIAVAHPDDQHRYTSLLFESLLTTPWSEAVEEEAFSRLQQLSPATDRFERLANATTALHRLVDAMLANRFAFGEKLLNDEGNLDKFTRKELVEKKSKIRKESQIAIAVRLAEWTTKDTGLLAPWFLMEKIWLDIQLGQNLAEADVACWKILGDAPTKPLNAEDERSESEYSERFFDDLLKHRALATVLYLAVRPKADLANIDRLLKYIDSGIGLGDDAADFWRMTKFQTLIALDRPDDLERELREWIRSDGSTAPWRQTLARLLAERGKLAEAIQLFEVCEKEKLLTASDYRMLSDWYLVTNRRDAYERSRIETFKQMPENALSQMMYQSQNRWSRSDIPLPSELDENTLFALKALFEKSAYPENYLYNLRTLYGASRDFRLLQMLPDAMLGRSPQQVYSFLQQLNNTVLQELRNEATADEILVRTKDLRNGERTVTDLRALDLLESLVERKSSDLLNQSAVHVDACLAALERAFQREWGDGEPRMMASFLYQLGNLPAEKLKLEQLRELRGLRDAASKSSREHLAITMDLCDLMFRHYSLQDESLRLMEAEVREYGQTNQGIWPHPDNDILSRYVSLLESAKRHTVGELLLRSHIEKPANNEQKKWLKARLLSLYNHALESDGAVSIGTGRANFFVPLVELFLKELEDAPDENARYTIVSSMVNTYDIAHRHQLQGTQTSVEKFAFEIIPTVLKRQEQQYQNTATAPLSIIHQTLGAKPSLQYIVERMEQYPERFEAFHQNAWNAFGNSLASRRHEAGKTELDERVLKLAIGELKHYLRTGESSNNSIYYGSQQYFWQEKSSDYSAAVEEVLNEQRNSGRLAMSVATYLRNGLQLKPRSIEILHIAHRSALLDKSQQFELTEWLREDHRFAEIIPLMEPLIEANPDVILYRTRLMAAYFHAQRTQQLQLLITQTDEHFHHAGRWTEGNATQFALGCFEANQWEQSKRYYTEAIALHQRGKPGSGLNDHALSESYTQLAIAESELGNTIEAVAATMSAIVCWDAKHEQRAYALNTLQHILDTAHDRDAFAAHLDAEAAKSGQDNPILRKLLGKAYQNKSEPDKAIAQFKLAIELQPNDKETHQFLIQCFDATENKSAASRQLLKLIDLQRHDLNLYRQLAERLKEDKLESERAITSIIESSPNEAETHAAIAEIRQSQDRWSEAIFHWNQVATLRKLEPTGLLKLAEAQIHEKRIADAKETVQKLHRTEWPTRFSNADSQIRQLQNRLPK